MRWILALTIAAAASLLVAAPASAQATRTWVSGVGDDVNPCSRTAPCKTFAGAISKTAAGGEISCLDSAGYGAVTITKSIAIYCNGVVAGILAASTNGIIVNAGDGDRVILSGLDIDGAGSGVVGIKVVKAGSVLVREKIVYGFTGDGSRGISVEGAASVTVDSTTIVHNKVGVFGPIKQGGGNLITANGTDLVPK